MFDKMEVNDKRLLEFISNLEKEFDDEGRYIRHIEKHIGNGAEGITSEYGGRRYIKENEGKFTTCWKTPVNIIISIISAKICNIRNSRHSMSYVVR